MDTSKRTPGTLTRHPFSRDGIGHIDKCEVCGKPYDYGYIALGHERTIVCRVECEVNHDHGCGFPTAGSEGEMQANAAYITRCWNSHDALVDACEQTQTWCESYADTRSPALAHVLARIRAALALAEGKT